MKQVLLVSIAFSPNVGGIETHFDDLTKELPKRNWRVTVLTYKPITTPVKAEIYEVKNGVKIIRIPWFSGIFYKLVKSPIVEFLYLLPGLFFALPLILLFKPFDVIHSHGLVAGFVSVFWGKIFGKRVITTTHSIYHFPKNGFYRKFGKWIFTNSDCVLTLSKQSKREIVELGIEDRKVKVFTYWIDLDKFRPIPDAKRNVGWGDKFVALFVGRLVPEKGVNELLEAAAKWNKKVTLAIAGSGPMEQEVKKFVTRYKNILFLGRLEQNELAVYYSASDIVIVPSTHEEGFGRVIIESLACGVPVIGSNRGAIPEAMNTSVGILTEVSKENLIRAVEGLFNNPAQLRKFAGNSRRFALERYSAKNIKVIINAYEEKK